MSPLLRSSLQLVCASERSTCDSAGPTDRRLPPAPSTGAHVGADFFGDPLSDLKSQVCSVDGRIVGVLVFGGRETGISLVQLALAEREVRHEGIDLLLLHLLRRRLTPDDIDGPMPGHGRPSRVAAAHLGSVGGASLDVLAPMELDQLVKPISAYAVLGQHVGGVGLAVDLP